MPHDLSLQEQFAPQSICFGCGPANPEGLHIRSFGDGVGEATADWTPSPHHEAFPGVMNGGIIGTLLDCHSNWTAAAHLMHERGRDKPPTTVTADFHVTMRKPTPSDAQVHLRSWVAESHGDRVTIEAELGSGGVVTATCRARFVAVKPGHPAHERW